MNEVALEIIKQLGDELQATRNTLETVKEDLRRAKEDASMWYKSWAELKAENKTEDLNDGNV